jgi:predicted ATP-grasp superfamily ATP-dependent carboligase
MQWAAPVPKSPFRYGGAAGPVDIDPAQGEKIAHSVVVIASELDLVGLNSADFLVSTDAVWLIEINPRPGATLDVFDSNEAPLFARHIAACEGHPTHAAANFAFKAAEIVYAPQDIVVGEGRDWPDWAVDRSPAGTRIAAGDPLCTTLGSGATVDLARACAGERARKIIALVQEADH